MNIIEKLAAVVVSETGYGALITHERLREIFGITQPQYEQYETQDEFLKAVEMTQFEYMSAVEELREILLTDYKMCMKNSRGEGYIILEPKEQVEYAQKKGVANAVSELRKHKNILENVNLQRLGSEHSGAVNDSVARMSGLISFLKA